MEFIGQLLLTDEGKQIGHNILVLKYIQTIKKKVENSKQNLFKYPSFTDFNMLVFFRCL